MTLAGDGHKRFSDFLNHSSMSVLGVFSGGMGVTSCRTRQDLPSAARPSCPSPEEVTVAFQVKSTTPRLRRYLEPFS